MDLSSLENEYDLNEINSNWDTVYDEARLCDDKYVLMYDYEYSAALSEKNRMFNRYRNGLPCKSSSG